DMPGPGLAPRVHRFHVNPLLKNTEDAGRGARGEGGRAGRLPNFDCGITSKSPPRASRFVGVKRPNIKKGREIKSRNPLKNMVGTE
ncbi:hypothetical protein, partial [Pseudomonas veronii]|uniref:hypothetical protein n=1 Tax=Pseudomonas veronii TaxID=76761 RepID=UPI001B807686